MLRLLSALALLGAAGTAQVPAQALAPAVQDPRQDPGLREQAAGAENRGEYGRAADLWLELSARDPARAEWVVAAGRCLGRAGRYNDAIDLLTRRRADFPGVLDLAAMLARTHLLKVERDPGALFPHLDYADAAALATEILAVDPGHQEARLILAQAHYGRGDRAAAVAAAEEAARRHPDHAGAQILIGRLCFDRFRELKQELEQAAEAGADAGEHARLVAAIDAERQRARAAFGRAAALDPERTFARVALGDLAARDGDVAAASEHYGTALATDPHARVGHEWLAANAGWQQRRELYEGARQRYLARPDADPRRAATLQFYAALAAYDGQQWQEAGAAFEAAVAANPDHVNSWYYAMVCAFCLGEPDRAEAAGARFAAHSAPGFADVLRALPPAQRGELAQIVQYLGDRAWQQGRKDHSRDLNHVVACLQDSADAWNNYAFLCRETGRFERALAGYEYAIQREPGSPQLWNDAGVVLQYHMGGAENLAKARTMYERALELAAAVLADETASKIDRERAEKARSDARKNLDALDAMR